MGWESPLLAWSLGGPDFLECPTLVGVPGKVRCKEEPLAGKDGWRMNDKTKVLMPLRIPKKLAWRANQF